MGGHLYQYAVPWQSDIFAALSALRRDVFERGDYFGAELGFSSPEEALKMASEEGTRSILDITKIADEPDYFTASALNEDELDFHFGTTKPSVAQIEASHRLHEDIDRGMARYVIAYEGDEPKHIVFVGYSYD